MTGNKEARCGGQAPPYGKPLHTNTAERPLFADEARILDVFAKPLDF